MARALSVNDLLNKKYKLFKFQDEWYDAFGCPEKCGVWFVWGNSGNGKTEFVLKLVKYLANFSTVAYNSLEEGGAHTMQQAFIRVGMKDMARRIILIEGENLEELEKRMSKPKSPEIYVIDSVQYFGINYRKYIEFKERHRSKLIIFISHADGKQPLGRTANSIMYDSALKIWVEGYQATSKGRYIGPNGGTYTTWAEGSANYRGELSE